MSRWIESKNVMRALAASDSFHIRSFVVMYIWRMSSLYNKEQMHTDDAIISILNTQYQPL